MVGSDTITSCHNQRTGAAHRDGAGNNNMTCLVNDMTCLAFYLPLSCCLAQSFCVHCARRRMCEYARVRCLLLVVTVLTCTCTSTCTCTCTYRCSAWPMRSAATGDSTRASVVQVRRGAVRYNAVHLVVSVHDRVLGHTRSSRPLHSRSCRLDSIYIAVRDLVGVHTHLRTSKLALHSQTTNNKQPRSARKEGDAIIDEESHHHVRRTIDRLID